MSSILSVRAEAETGAPRRFAIHAAPEAVLLVASLFWTLSANAPFFRAAMRERLTLDAASWGFLLALGVALTALHVLILGLVAHRRLLKPVLVGLTVLTALGSFYIQRYGVYLDPGMLRNVLHTNPAEAGELITGSLVLHLAVYAGLPLLVLWRVRVAPRHWRRALAARAIMLALAALTLVGTVLIVFQPFASMMRNHKEARYLITPANLLYSTAASLAADARGAAQPREPIGLDARRGPTWAQRTRPLVVVLVVGETARAANWGLNGYGRQTTPELAALPVLNFPQVTSCGTNTEVSVPCLFAPVGRRAYDENRIRGQESLLHLLARTGVDVHWRDNQSGCKGVCDGLPNDNVSALQAPGLCRQGHCLDEGLLVDIDERLARASGMQVWVMHQLGNHGPAYSRRYPGGFARFQPACEKEELGQCTREEIVNAYDNALLYTDHLLASLIAKLNARAVQVDTVMLYVSDHGESLGENGLYLHGIPYAIAPEVQTRVPMVMWWSNGAASSLGLDTACLRGRAARPASPDNLFHTVLGLVDVQTELYQPDSDLTAECRRAS
jgi:lipid A ethanolaminephosphotransferase